MRHLSRTSSRPARAALTLLTASVLLLGAASTAVAADDGDGSAAPDNTAVVTPQVPPVPASVGGDEGGLNPAPTRPARAAQTAPLRVLLEGDSITHGFNGDYTWRYRLAREFTRQHKAVDFVGSNHLPYVNPAYRTSVYADPHFDSDHFARGGSLLEQHATEIAAEAKKQRPDLVVLAAGVNDLRWNRSPAKVEASLRSWVANLRDALAEDGEPARVQIVLSPVLPTVDATRPGLEGKIADYDSRLPGIAGELSTADSPITVADTGRGWSIAKYTWDNIHPTPTGEALIAQHVAEALHAMKVLPQAPRISGYRAWGRNLRAVVRLSGTRARVTWDRQTISYARIWVRRAGHAGHYLRAHYYSGAATLPTLVRGATYEVRMVAVRGRMTSTPGPATRVHVPRATAHHRR